MSTFYIEISMQNRDGNVHGELCELINEYTRKKNIDFSYTIKEVEYITIRGTSEKGSWWYILQSDIIFIEKLDHRVIFHTSDGCYTSYTTLKELERILNPHRFCRVHQGFIINICEIKCIFREEILLLSSDRSIPLSRRNRLRLKEKVLPAEKQTLPASP